MGILMNEIEGLNIKIVDLLERTNEIQKEVLESEEFAEIKLSKLTDRSKIWLEQERP